MTKFTKTKEWLIDEYVNKNKSRKEIAEECGLTVSGLKSLLIKWNIKKEKLVITKEKLKELIDKKLNHEEIEEILGIGQTTLYRYLKKYELNILANPNFKSTYDDTNDTIICQLYQDGFSCTDLAKEFNTTPKTILVHLRHCNIPIRDNSECQWVYNNKNFPKELESYESLYNLYIIQRLSKKDIAIKFNCDPSVIDRLLHKFNIPIRSNSESKIGLITGNQHWNWKGGITTLARRLREYFGTNQVKKVLDRDYYKCQLCGSKKDLQVHHIKHFSTILKRIINSNPNLDPIKDVNKLYDIAIKDTEFNDLNNLVTYCKYCHLHKVHGYNL